MNATKRACLAWIIGHLVKGGISNLVLDQTHSSRLRFEGLVDHEQVDVSETSRRCHLAGRGNGTRFDLMDLTTRKELKLLVSGRYFRGYDQETDSHFSGTVNGDLVSIFDFHRPRWYEFRLESADCSRH